MGAPTWRNTKNRQNVYFLALRTALFMERREPRVSCILAHIGSNGVLEGGILATSAIAWQASLRAAGRELADSFHSWVLERSGCEGGGSHSWLTKGLN